MSKSTSHSFAHKSSDFKISSTDVNQRQLNMINDNMNNRDQQHQPQQQLLQQQQQQLPAFSARVVQKRRRLESGRAGAVFDGALQQHPEAYDSPAASPADYSAPSPAAFDHQTGHDAHSFSSPVPQTISTTTTTTTSPSSQPQISHSLLHQAISQGDLTLLDSLLQTLASSSITGIQSCVNGFNADGQTLLTHACLMGNAKMVKLLVNSGASIRQTNRDGWSPAHIASFKGSFDIMMFLMNCGRRRPNYGHLSCTPPSREGGAGRGNGEGVRLDFSRPESPVDSEVNANASVSSSSPQPAVDANPDTPFSAPATPMSSPPTPYSESETITPVKRRRSSSSTDDSFNSSSFDDSYIPFSPASPASPSPASPLASNYESTCFTESKNNVSSASSSQQQQQQQQERQVRHQNHHQQCSTRIFPTSTHHRQQNHHHDLPPQSPLPHHHQLKSLDPVIDTRIPFSSSSSSSSKAFRVDGDVQSARVSASQSSSGNRASVCTCARASRDGSCCSQRYSRAIAKTTTMTPLETFPWSKRESQPYSDCPSPPASPVAQHQHY